MKVWKKLEKFCPVSEQDPKPCLSGLKIESKILPDVKTTFLASQNTWGIFYGVIYKIVTEKGGTIIDSEIRITKGKRVQKRLFFLIKCKNKHEFWKRKDDLNQGQWCPHPDCRFMSIEEHQKEIEHIVIEKGGTIIKGEKRLGGKKQDKVKKFFEIECEKNHIWWVEKGNLKPSKYNTNGSWCPICANRIASIGNLIHIIIEYFTLVYLKKKNCSVFYEKSINDKSIDTIPDLQILNDKHFKIFISKNKYLKALFFNINIILIDFTITSNLQNIIEKCYREYQCEDRFLIIVLLREEKGFTTQYVQKIINDDKGLNKKKTIIVFNLEDYIKFLNFNKLTEWEKKIEKKILIYIRLANKAINSDKAYKELSYSAQYYKKKYCLF